MKASNRTNSPLTPAIFLYTSDKSSLFGDKMFLDEIQKSPYPVADIHEGLCNRQVVEAVWNPVWLNYVDESSAEVIPTTRLVAFPFLKGIKLCKISKISKIENFWPKSIPMQQCQVAKKGQGATYSIVSKILSVKWLYAPATFKPHKCSERLCYPYKLLQSQAW